MYVLTPIVMNPDQLQIGSHAPRTRKVIELCLYYCTVLNHSLFTLIYIYFVVSAISKITFLEIEVPVSIRKIQ